MQIKRDNFNGNKLYQLRMVRGLSRVDVANICGKSVSTIQAYETGKFNPSPKALCRLYQSLNVKPEYFFEIIDDL